MRDQNSHFSFLFEHFASDCGDQADYFALLEVVEGIELDPAEYNGAVGKLWDVGTAPAIERPPLLPRYFACRVEAKLVACEVLRRDLERLCHSDVSRYGEGGVINPRQLLRL